MIQAAHTYDLLHYDVHVSLDPAERQGTVRTDLKLKGTRSPAPTSLQFVLHRAMRLAAVSEGGRALTYRSAAPLRDYPGALVTVFLDRPLTEGEERTITFETRFSSKANEPRLAHAAYVGPAEAFTDLGSAWVPGMPYDTFGFDLRIECPRWMTVVGNGPLASCEPREADRQEFHFRSNTRMWIINFVAGRYARTVRQVEGATLEVLVAEGEKLPVETMLDDLQRAFSFCVREFGPPGIDRFTLIQAPESYDAASYNGYCYAFLRRAYFPFLGKSMDEGGAAWYGPLCHEVAHTWWGYRAMSDILGNGGNWLREGLAETTSGLALEERFGPDFADFAFRRRLHSGFLDDLRSLQGAEPSLVDVSYLSPQDLSYEKGAYAFLMLRDRIGPEGFREVLRRYLDEASRRFANYRDFQDIAEEVHGHSLKDIVRPWVVGTRHADLAVVSAETRPRDGQFESDIVVSNLAPNAFPVAAELSVACATGSPIVEQVLCGPEPHTVKVVTDGTPTRIELDPRWRVLDVDRSNNSSPRGADGGMVTHFVPGYLKRGDAPAGQRKNGILVSWLREGSPLFRVGLRAGDVVVDIAGADIVGPDHLGRALFPQRAGDEVRLKVARGGRLVDVQGRLE